ncbi:MAG: protein kinase [Vicinamibacterales bacterium]
MLLAARVVIGVAALKLLWMLAAVLAGTASTTSAAGGLAFGLPATVFLAVAFGGVGLFLVWASPSHARGWWLGATLLLIATAFGDAVLRQRLLTGAEERLGQALAVDALLPFAWWSFLGRFPQTERPSPRRLAAWCARVAAVAGTATFVANLAARLSLVPARLADILAIDRRGPWYLVSVIALSAAGLPYLWHASRQGRPDDRPRVRIFAAGLVGGCGPLLLDVLASAASPAYDRWAWQPEIRAVRLPALFALLALVPLTTAYSVLVDRVVDLRVALRAAAQYMLARYTLLALVSVPFVVLAAYLYEHRGEPLGTLLSGPRVVWCLVLIGAGVAALSARRRWLRSLDHRFFRGDTDSAALVTALGDHARAATTESELSAFIRDDVARALAVEHAALLIADPGRTALVDPGGRMPSLSTTSNLAVLLSGDSTPLEVAGPAANAMAARLPAAERGWLSDTGVAVLVPLRRTPTTLAAALVLGPRKSGLRFGAADHRALSAVAAAVGLALENHRLKSSPSGDDEEPAEECLGCGTLLPAGAARCYCGGSLAHAPVPLVLRHAFRFERRLGAGGMGVVYRAADLSLNRSVAIKTLPRVSPGRAERLRDEARTMARLAHPHLATIHGVETWRGTPLVVVELLGGGTLADRLRVAPLALDQVADLGLDLAEVLGHIHDADMVHCDIKPSNIGFNRNGTVKLLDFGLAQWLAEQTPFDDAAHTSALDLTSTHLSSTGSFSRPAGGRIAGTPLYMAPEALEAQAPSPRFDLWSTAVVLYEALAGHHPFAGGTTEQVLTRIRRGECLGLDVLRARWPAACVDVLARCLSADPAARPPSARAFADRLRQMRSLAASA